jgi:hypothetical protein
MFFSIWSGFHPYFGEWISGHVVSVTNKLTLVIELTDIANSVFILGL